MNLEEYKAQKYLTILKWVNSHIILAGKKPANCKEVSEVYGCESFKPFELESYEYLYDSKKMATPDTFDFFIEVMKDVAYSKELNSKVSINFYSNFEKIKIIVFI